MKMSKIDCEPLKEWLYGYTAQEDKDSERWLWWNFLDELTQGYLVHFALEGELDPKVLMEHAFWIVGIHQQGGMYSSFVVRPKDEASMIHYALKKVILALSPRSIRCDDALDRVDLFGRHSLAGISLGRNDDGKEGLILYYLPIFSVEQALGYLAHTALIDDEAAKTRPW